MTEQKHSIFDKIFDPKNQTAKIDNFIKLENVGDRVAGKLVEKTNRAEYTNAENKTFRAQRVYTLDVDALGEEQILNGVILKGQISFGVPETKTSLIAGAEKCPIGKVLGFQMIDERDNSAKVSTTGEKLSNTKIVVPFVVV